MTHLHLPLLAVLLAGAPPAPVPPAPATSPWWAADPGAPARGWQVEVSARALVGTGRTAYTLYDSAGAALLSRLDFHGLDGAGGELSARLSTDGRLWATATAGLGARDAGTLQDEDFQGGSITVYSSTDSDLRGGRAWTLVAAAGADVHQGPSTRLGLFAGLRLASETLHAFGCRQSATNPLICAPGDVSPGARAITARTRWTAPMVGVDGALRLTPELTASASVAVLPLVSIAGSDTHWLRIGPQAQGFDFSGPTPITASGGFGYQVEAALRWRTPLGLDLGLSGRLTRLEARRGLMHFEESFYPATSAPVPAQVLSLVTERRQLWLEAGWRL